MIIDGRCRPPTKEFLDFLRAPFYVKHIFPRWAVHGEYPPSAVQGSLELFWKEFQEAGITKAVMSYRASPDVPGGASASNDYLASLVRQHPDKFVGIAAIDVTGKVHPKPLEEIDRCIQELGFRGVALEPGVARPPIHYHDERLFPIYEKCDELGVPVFLFTSPFLGDSMEYEHPRGVEVVARQFRRLNIIMPHGGWPYVMEYMGLASRYSTVHLMPDAFSFLPGMKMYLEAANSILQDQLIFGTAYPVAPLKRVVDFYKEFPFTPLAREKVMFRNAQRLFKIE